MVVVLVYRLTEWRQTIGSRSTDGVVVGQRSDVILPGGWKSNIQKEWMETWVEFSAKAATTSL